MPCTSWSKFEDSVWQANASSSWIVKELRMGFWPSESFSWLILHRVWGVGVSTPKSKILIAVLTSSSFHSCTFKNEYSWWEWMCVGSRHAGAVTLQLVGARHLLPLFVLSVSTLLPRIKGWVFFSFKSKLISETNHKNNVSWKTLTLASAGLTQLILSCFGTDADRLTSVSKAEWLLCGVPFLFLCAGVCFQLPAPL